MGRRYRAVLLSYWEAGFFRLSMAFVLGLLYIQFKNTDFGTIGPALWAAFGAFISSVLVAGFIREQIDNPRAMIIPRFRRPHVVIALAVLALIILISAIIISLAGVNLVGALAISVCVVAFSIWCFFVPSFLFFILMVLFWIVASVVVMALPERWSGPTALILGSAIIAVWAWRLMHLHKEISHNQTKSSERLNTRPLFTGRKLNRRIKVVRSEDESHRTFTKVAWQRVQLRRFILAGITPRKIITWLLAPWALISLLAQSAAIREALSEPPTKILLLYFGSASLGPFWCAATALQNRHRLACESLRPCSKSQFLGELGFAVAMNATLTWIGLVIGYATTGVIWFYELMSIEGLLLLFLSAGVLVLILGLAAWATSLRSENSPTGVILVGVMVGFGVIFLPVLIVNILNWVLLQPSLPLGIFAASVMVLAGLSFAGLAHRRWCEMELG